MGKGSKRMQTQANIVQMHLASNRIMRVGKLPISILVAAMILLAGAEFGDSFITHSPEPTIVAEFGLIYVREGF